MPTMTDGESPYDPKTTPSVDMGVTADLFWRQPGVVRSGHLFASVIQAGRKAKPAVGPLGWLSREVYRAGLSVRWFAYNLASRLRGRTPADNG